MPCQEIFYELPIRQKMKIEKREDSQINKRKEEHAQQALCPLREMKRGREFLCPYPHAYYKNFLIH